MKLISTLSLAAALSLSISAFAQSDGMKGMDMKDENASDCMPMKGMKDMDAKKCRAMMKSMDDKKSSTGAASAVHTANAVVKSVDVSQGKVTLAHEPVTSLGWPAMTMGFAVKDKRLFDKLAVGRKVRVELQKEGSDYVVTAVK